MLMGSGSWVLTRVRESILRTIQLKMLRTMLGKQRFLLPNGSLETWVDWMKRTTSDVRQLMVSNKIPEWPTEQRMRVQKWAQKLGEMGSDRWAKKALDWQPEGFRSRGHPLTRWSGQLETRMTR